ncbi:MAG: hypothetical protein M3O41_08370 [Pseudomonadota bacterium]|nr:hypothetical protein [Pseudomonadota bacterium]
MKFRARLLGKAALLLAVVAILGWVVMELWNNVATSAIAGAHPLDYFHSLGLLVLSRILFGGFRGHAGGHRHGQRARWKAMTPQERQAFRQRLHNKSSSVHE